MSKNDIAPTGEPFSYMWKANCVLYTVVTAFLLEKGWKKHTVAGRSGKSCNQKWRRVYEEKVKDIRSKTSIAKSELERLKENRKVTKKGKRNRTKL